MYGQTSGNGVQICVEPLNEWKIQEITYSGEEKYIKPPEFRDVLRKNAKKISWRRVVGSEASLDTFGPPSDEDEEGPSSSSQQVVPATHYFEPVAGPWAAVAKHLHHSLQEVNILLDALSICRMPPSYYLDTPRNTQLNADSGEADQISHSKSFQLCTRKKVLSEASRVIDRIIRGRKEISLDVDKGSFFNELRELRENWRIRKVGNNIFGDLGYKTYAPKFAAHEVFDVTQKSVTARRESTLRCGNLSYIGIGIPHNLRFRTQLFVFIQPDAPVEGTGSEKASECLFKDSNAQFPSESEEDDFVRHLDWRKALPWAQNSLMCKDILAQLIKDSVSQEDMVSLSTENSIIFSLFDNLLLRVHLQFYPFQEAKLPSDGIPYLSQCLRELFLAEHTRKQKRNQHFVNLPQTAFPENLDMRGPQALTSDEISFRMRSTDPLVKKFVDCGTHYVLVWRTVAFLEEFAIRWTDPQLNWRWIRATRMFSLISLNITSRGWENLGKFSGHIRISNNSVTLVGKEAQQIGCRRDMAMLGEALHLLSVTFLMNSLNALCRAYQWQIFHANSNAHDAAGNSAPTFYACNQTATKNLFVQFCTNGNSPSIFIRDCTEDQQKMPEEKEGQPRQQQAKTGTRSVDLNGFCKLDYDRVPGQTFMRRMENLLLAFIN